MIQLIILFFSFFIAHAKTELQILQYSQVPENEEVKLKYLIKPNEKAAQLKEQIVFNKLDQNKKLLLSRVEMARVLEKKIDDDSIVFRIPEQMVIEAKKNMISEFDVSLLLQSEVQKKCDCIVEIKNLKMPLIPQKSQMSDWVLNFTNAKLSGPVIIPLQVNFNEIQNTYWITAQVELYKEGFVSRKAIANNEKYQSIDFEKKLINITYQKESLAKESELVDQSFKRSIPVGTPVFVSDLKRTPLVTKGQIIKVIMEGKDIEVSIQAVAEETGYMDEVIKIKNMESQKTISARLIGKGVARIE
jgi:flagella basal body P-ring formation protein FlgA